MNEKEQHIIEVSFALVAAWKSKAASLNPTCVANTIALQHQVTHLSLELIKAVDEYTKELVDEQNAATE